jgi:hypothetical protein
VNYARIGFLDFPYVVESPPGIDARQWAGASCEMWSRVPYSQRRVFVFTESPKPWPGYRATYRWVEKTVGGESNRSRWRPSQD